MGVFDLNKCCLATNPEVFTEIENRLSKFTPKIVLKDHIEVDIDKINHINDVLDSKNPAARPVSSETKAAMDNYIQPLLAYRNTLLGIDFVVKDREDLLTKLEIAKAYNLNEGGFAPAFAKGSSNDWDRNWALTLSFLATQGVGFREIFRPLLELPNHLLLPNHNITHDSRFGRELKRDISSLHIAVSDFAVGKVRPGEILFTWCNIHIDNLTVVVRGLGNEFSISPTSINHFINELVFKTWLQGLIPNWIIDRTNISFLNPDEGFLRAGVSIDLVKKSNFTWSIYLSTGFNNNAHREWSGDFKFENSVVTTINGTF